MQQSWRWPGLATLSKKRLWHRCFPVSFKKFFKNNFFIEDFSGCYLLKLATINLIIVIYTPLYTCTQRFSSVISLHCIYTNNILFSQRRNKNIFEFLLLFGTTQLLNCNVQLYIQQFRKRWSHKLQHKY